MEFAYAGKFQGIIVKAVADYGNENKKQYAKWKKFAAVVSAKYTLYHLERTKMKGTITNSVMHAWCLFLTKTCGHTEHTIEYYLIQTQ
jgi:hypothetical protein